MATTTKRAGRPRSSGAGCRLRKLSCADCGFIARATLGALERCGTPRCACGRELELEQRAPAAAPAPVVAPAAPVVAPAELEQHGSNGYRNGKLPGALQGSSLPRVGSRPSRAAQDPSVYKPSRDPAAELHKIARALEPAPYAIDARYRETFGEERYTRALRRPLEPVFASVGEAIEARVREAHGLETSDGPYKPFRGHELVRAQYGATSLATSDAKAFTRFASKHAAKAKKARARARKAAQR